MKGISWRELRDVCRLFGWVEVRTRGDHLVMTKPGMARPVIIKMDRNLGEDIIRSNMHTMRVSRGEFLAQLDVVRRHRKTTKGKKRGTAKP